MLTIFAVDIATKELIEIKDLYWFEENYIHTLNDINDDPTSLQFYTFEVFLNGVKIWETPKG